MLITYIIVEYSSSSITGDKKYIDCMTFQENKTLSRESLYALKWISRSYLRM